METIERSDLTPDASAKLIKVSEENKEETSESILEERNEAAEVDTIRSSSTDRREEIATFTRSQRVVIPFNKPPFFKEDLDAAIADAHAYGKFSGDGLLTKRCTDFFKSEYGYERCLLTPSCTASLEMAAFILELGPGDEVIVPSFTFVTSANAFVARGVTVVFADSEEDQPNVSVSDILKKVTDKTKAIVVVHYAGVAVDVHRLLKETNNSIPIVEDCAHAIEAKTTYCPSAPNMDYIGKAGCLATFSFHETKNLGIGEGGLLVVNDKKLWRKAQITREKGTNRIDFFNGKVDKYSWVDLGSSYLMSEIDAAMLWSGLLNLDRIQKARLDVWDVYDNDIIETTESSFKKPSRKLRANAHMYFLTFNEQKVCTEFCKYMKEKDILVTTHYVPLDASPYILQQREKKLLPEAEPCTNADRWSKTLVRLPLFADLTVLDQQAVIKAINKFDTERNCSQVSVGSEIEELRYEAADYRYWEYIRLVRNANGKCFGNSDEVEVEEHYKFMSNHAGTYRVVLQGDEFMGFIGHVNNDVRLATNSKGKGVAKYMWDRFIEEFASIDLEVKVLKDNGRSLSFFRKQGYVPDPEAVKAGKNPLPLIKEKIDFHR